MPDGKPITPRKAKRVKIINAVDLFCGAGGTSSGLINAVNSLGYEIKLTAINHWDVAIATHSRNHEDVTHLCQSIDTLDPLKIIPDGRLQLLVASPECIHHSRARGGKPRSDQKRADAWMLMRWIDKLYVENILIENVEEFKEWGPLTASGRPDKRHKGKYFKQFLDALSVNYTVDHRIINCADHGDPTTRKRLFILARRGHKKIVWPKRTHASRKELAKLAAEGVTDHGLLPWVAAREIIDWDLEGRSIFGRKKDLSPNTMKRIFAGLERYSLKPFLVPQFTSPDTRDIDRPLGVITSTSRGVGLAEPFMVNLKNADRRDRNIDEPTFTQAAGGNHQAVCEPFIVSTGHTTANGSNTRSADEPIATVTASPRIGVVEVEPFVISAGGPELGAKTVDEPLRSVLTRDHQAVVEPFIVSAAHGGNTNPARDIDEPLGAVLGSNKFAVVEAETFLIGQQSKAAARPVDEPVPTVAGAGAIGKVDVEPFLIKNFSGSDASRSKSVDEPVGSIAANFNHHYLVEPFLVKYHGNHASKSDGDKRTKSIDEPVPTLDTSNRLGVAEPFIFNMAHTGNMTEAEHASRCVDIETPIPSVAGKGMFGVVEPYLVNMKGRSTARDIDEPTFTQTKQDHQYVAEPFVLNMQGDQPQNTPIEEPVPTLLTGNHKYIVEPYLVKYYGSGENADAVTDPLATVTARDRFGLVDVEVLGDRRRKGPDDGEIGMCFPDLGIVVFIRFRMLQPHELAAAMSFPKSYRFEGNRESKVKQIGNSVPLLTAKALCTALLTK